MCPFDPVEPSVVKDKVPRGLFGPLHVLCLVVSLLLEVTGMLSPAGICE
jgi:hypothetical protein